jgi:hypothetical protein
MRAITMLMKECYLESFAGIMGGKKLGRDWRGVMPDLSPCPFCGGKLEIKPHTSWKHLGIMSEQTTFFYPYCPGCGMKIQPNGVGFETIKEAVEAANRRAADGTNHS